MTGGGGAERMARRKLAAAKKLKVPALPGEVEPLSRTEFTLACGITPDPWQAAVLESEERKILMCCSRQSGKSTVAALRAVHEAVYVPGSLVLMLAPSLRQSGELFRTTLGILKRVDVEKPQIVAESVLRVEMESGSRIVALPGSESTTRGYAAADLVIIDEAARVEDALIAAVRPSLATTGGPLIALSTPSGRRGWYHAEWAAGVGWFRTKVTADDCPRISPEFLADEERLLGPMAYRQEYFCEFFDADSQYFDSEMIERALSDELEPLWEGV